MGLLRSPMKLTEIEVDDRPGKERSEHSLRPKNGWVGAGWVRS